jgi:uncharacterized protein YndB with AHSA1/START domain
MTDPSAVDSQAESGTEPRERVIDLSVDVTGTPEQVWQAIATGPGISSWYVPTTVEEREGGAITNRFGEGPEMLIPGRVTAWEPPHRIVFDGGEDIPGLAFEWLVEARENGTCVVRLVNSGFVEGTPWDDQYDGMLEGWALFLRNLALHLAHFPGRAATAMLPTAMWPLSAERAWAVLTAALGLPESPATGDRVAAAAVDTPPLAGTVVQHRPGNLAVLLDEPAPGTAFLACEGVGEQCGVSVWCYLYGADAAELVQRDEPRWIAWLQARSAQT